MIATHYIYWLIFVLMICGLYTVLSHGHLVKKLIGLNIFQASVFLLYIAFGKVARRDGADHRRRGSTPTRIRSPRC